jgi:hypothetical protein
LGLLIKRSEAIETPDDISQKSMQKILGKDYEQLA